MNAAGATLFGLGPAMVTLTAQATCLLLLALALAWLGRRGSPRTLHLLWTTTFVLVLVLPILGPIGPSWNVPLLPAAAGEPQADLASGYRELLLEDVGPVPPPETADMRRALVVEQRARLDGRAVGTGDSPANAATWHAVLAIARIAWIIGFGFSLILLAVSALRLQGLVRTARHVRDPEWVRQAEELRHRLGLRTKVRLLSNVAVDMPMTGGLWRPVILLPESAASWCRERRAVVLSHELVHVRRRDALRRLMRRAVLAIYWFHPLVWIASRQAALASEKACDEEVLRLGPRPSEYARHLLFLASGLTRGGPRALALPIAQASQLERRITSILARRRPQTSLLRTALTLMVIGAAGVSVAFVRPVPRPVPTVVSAEIPTEAFQGAAARAAIVADTAAESRRDQTATQAVLRGIECMPSSTDSIRSFHIRGSGSMVRNWKWTDGGFTIVRPVADRLLCMRAEGDVTLNAEGTAVRTLGEDSWLVLESRGDRTHRLAVTRTPDGVEREWRVDGVRQPFDEEARQWRELMFAVMHGYLEAWLPYSAAISLYGRISGYRDNLSKLRSSIRDDEQARARRLARDLVRWEVGLRRTAETIWRSGLDDNTEAVARRLAEYDLAAARFQTDTEASELEDLLREVTEQVQSEIETRGLDVRLAEAERSLEGVIAELQEVTR